MSDIELPRWAQRLWEPHRHVAMWGGRGGGKSRSVASALVLQAAQSPRRILCAREVQKSIKDSVKRLLDDEIERCGLSSFFTSTETEIRGKNGSLFIFAGLRGNAAGIKSYEGVTDCWIEEAQTVSQGSIDTLIPTIRQPGSRLLWTWNPDLPMDPVDAMFRGESGAPPDSDVIEVQWSDNPWFPEVLRVEMEHTRSRDIDKYNHVWLGQYRQNSEARVFKNWKVEAFESPANVEYRIGADFGFSIDPSCAVRCWIDGTRVYIDYEAWGLQVEIPNLPRLFMTIPEAERYWMTADSSRPETISYLRKNGFPRIAAALKGARSVEEGVEWLKGYDLIVHPRCEHMIDELTHYSYEIDSLTGQVLPKLADKDNHCVAEGSLIWTRRGDVPVESVVVGDEVMTRAGWKRVLWSGVTDVDRDVVYVAGLRCTPDHQVYTQRGFVRADALRYGDEIIMEGSAWSRLSNGTDINGGAIRKATARATEIISNARKGVAHLSRCIAPFTSIISGLSRRIITSIISTMIPATMTRSTLSACTSRSTLSTMSEKAVQKTAAPSSASTSTASGTYPKDGMQAKRAGRPTELLAAWPTKTSSQSKSRVRNVVRHSCPVRSATGTVFAQTLANQLGGERQESMTLIGRALNAARTFASTAIQGRRLVHVPVQTVCAAGRSERVYDLTVDGQHEFFADGVLVHNCVDALRYALEGARRALQNKPEVVSITMPSMATGWKR